jgi:hypothetical protein
MSAPLVQHTLYLHGWTITLRTFSTLYVPLNRIVIMSSDAATGTGLFP